LDRLWSPWRARYVASGVDSGADECVFCEIGRTPEHDSKNYVVHRSLHCYAVLNLYPYVTGHLLVVPYQHIADLASTPKPITDELMDLTKRSQEALRSAYAPPGFNLGMNLGAAAGAGIANHLHMHILPRWSGDTNFMTTVANARVIPEGLDQTYARLLETFSVGLEQKN
jgi:ATP adenylyltransferase